MIKDLLQGKPFKHPLHPALVHYPIALFLLSLLFDSATIFAGAGNSLVLAAFYTLLFGLVMALLAAVPGFLDWYDIRPDHRGKRTATTHMLLNLTAVGLYSASLFLRYSQLNLANTATVPFLLSLVALGILFVSGYLGGSLVYNEGIAVGWYRRRTKMPDKTVEMAPTGQPGELVPIIPADRLGEGQTVRAEIAGHVMVIARIEDEYYAFQEFCTHRFGPLSEGESDHYRVMCPWHRSCFDVRTGQVVQGPATVDLKTYEVRVRDGQLHVRVPPEEAEAEAVEQAPESEVS
jgi:nitrite reductase/ring-hydroxylating ferredoxin subunit/uncharacterized membrane protein